MEKSRTALGTQTNRRTFLKSIATACGAAVVCPGELLKSPIKHVGVHGKRSERIYIIDHPAFHNVVISKARQQGCTNSIFYGIPYWVGIEK